MPMRGYPEDTERKLQGYLVRLADQEDFHVANDLPALAFAMKRDWQDGNAGVFEGFAIGVTEQPHKLPYYSALLVVLSQDQYLLDQPLIKKDPAALEGNKEDSAAQTADDPTTTDTPMETATDVKVETDDDVKMEPSTTDEKVESEEDVSRRRISWLVIQNMNERFGKWVVERHWLKVRLCLQFFAQLVNLNLISPTSFTSTLQTFTAALSDDSLSGTRAERYVRAVTSALMRAGPAYFEKEKESVVGMIAVVQEYAQQRSDDAKAINDPLFAPRDIVEKRASGKDQIDHCSAVLQKAQESGLAVPRFLPDPSKRLRAEGDTPGKQFDLSPILLSAVETETAGPEDAEGWIGTLSASQHVGLTVGRVPDMDDPEGWVMTLLILDVVQVYEVNRIECAKLLTSLTNFVLPDAFMEAPPRPAPGAVEEVPESTYGHWVLPSTIISIILGILVRLPIPSYKTIYLVALTRELCLIDRSGMAYPIGQAVRKLYTRIGSGIDIEITKRLADWFSIHLSNFDFSWIWKEWVPDMDLPLTHPKRAFMHRLIEMEIRLAYHDRIMESLPPAMQLVEDMHAPALQPTDPLFPYESPDHEHHAIASELMGMMNRKEGAEAVIQKVREVAGLTAPDQPIPSTHRYIAMMCILNLGARSFSHFLNAVERYQHLIFALGRDKPEKQDLLMAVHDFWKYNSQMKVIVIDKYLQYGVVEAADVVSMVFGELSKPAISEDDAHPVPTVWTNYFGWEILHMVIDKSQGRMVNIERRVADVEDKEKAAKARHAALEQPVTDVEERVDEETEVEAKPKIVMEGDSSQLQELKARRANLKQDYANLLYQVTSCFVQSLVPETCTGQFATESQWNLQNIGELPDLEKVENPAVWDVVARLGWFRQFMRYYGINIAQVSADLIERKGVFSGFPTVVDVEMRDVDVSTQAALTVKAIYEQGLRNV
ncbi:hypothetical protein QFC21_007015 [Naganishia friedmannii]|uniref:Uncharacterized protein n=1 Tax=Naganishia friedmannii TaxID=89922 RepID=A0ACC2UY83_9TREE|nr:hypothetical protein QFC21_007015 [Naganishia friedmannii]